MVELTLDYLGDISLFDDGGQKYVVKFQSVVSKKDFVYIIEKMLHNKVVVKL
jgi:hypothetical protein